MNPDNQPYTLTDLLGVIASLRDPDSGCPWDLKQTYASLVPFTIEECYELADAIDRQDYAHMKEELGDVLLQIVLYAQLAREDGYFDFHHIVHRLTDKLIIRHPHVFHSQQNTTPLAEQQIKASWETSKSMDRAARDQHGLLDDIPLALPALMRAVKLQNRAATVRFDWHNPQDVLAKVREELDELQQAIASNEAGAIQQELGDVLFSCINLSRHLKLDPESALRSSNQKFERRIRHMEQHLAAQNTTLQETTPEQMELLWQQAKQAEGK